MYSWLPSSQSQSSSQLASRAAQQRAAHRRAPLTSPAAAAASNVPPARRSPASDRYARADESDNEPSPAPAYSKTGASCGDSGAAERKQPRRAQRGQSPPPALQE